MSGNGDFHYEELFPEGLEDVIEVVASKYGPDILALLATEGPLRYGDIRERTGVTSDSTLSKRLDQLQ